MCVEVCVCALDRLLCPLRPLSCGCAVLCSGNNDGFRASQSLSQQDTHIKGSFSGSFCVCLCVGFAIVYVCVCAQFCVILRTSFSEVHADCAPHCARVQPIKVHIGTLALCLCLYLSLSLALSPSLPPHPFSIYLYVPLFFLHVWFLLSSNNISALPLCKWVIGFYQGSLSFLLGCVAQIEATVHENNSSSWKNFEFPRPPIQNAFCYK